jgi:hypothetical protein
MRARLGHDVTTPAKRGQFEATLELEKLPRILEERINRLSDAGLDARARAEVEEDIANLDRQYRDAKRRFAEGAAAETLGYVAAEGRKRAGPFADLTEREIDEALGGFDEYIEQAPKLPPGGKAKPIRLEAPTPAVIAELKARNPELAAALAAARAKHPGVLLDGVAAAREVALSRGEPRPSRGEPGAREPFVRMEDDLANLRKTEFYKRLARRNLAPELIHRAWIAMLELNRLKIEAWELAAGQRKAEEAIRAIRDPKLKSFVTTNDYLRTIASEAPRLLEERWARYNQRTPRKLRSAEHFAEYLRAYTTAHVAPAGAENLAVWARFHEGDVKGFFVVPDLKPNIGGIDYAALLKSGGIELLDDKNYKADTVHGVTALLENLGKNMTKLAADWGRQLAAEQRNHLPIDPDVLSAQKALARAAQEAADLTRRWKPEDYRKLANQRKLRDVLEADSKHPIKLVVTSAMGSATEVSGDLAAILKFKQL